MTDLALVSRAIWFAAKAHADQRYNGLPYLAHLAQVAEVLRRFSLPDDELMAAAWLHDVVEDTSATVPVLVAEFGNGVATLVWAVTDYAGRGTSWPKIQGRSRATRLKLADRIANVEAALIDRPDKLTMYQAEHRAFRAALYPPTTGATELALCAYLDTLIGKDAL